MELRNYLDVVSRRRRILVYVTLLGLVLGAVASLVRTPVYRAEASLLLQPNNPAERVSPDPGGYFDPERHAADQVIVITGEQVMQRAATRLDLSRRELEDKVTAAVGNSGGVVTVAATDIRPAQASATANAVAEAYIEDRRTTEVAALTRAAAKITEQLTALTERIAVLRRDAPKEGGDAALEAANLQYTSLYSRQQDLLIDSSLKQGGARVVSAASTPTTAEGLSLPVSILLGGLLGLMLGLAVAFARDHLDDRLRSRGEVESLTGQPVLADLPVDRQLGREPQRVAMRDEPLGPFAEATRALRTSISFLGVEEPIRRIMVSSAVSGEGKTVVAANLAVAFAQAGSRTLLVSADLRRPRVEELFGIRRTQQGLSTVLAIASFDRGRQAGEAGDVSGFREALQDAMVGTDLPNLTVLPAGLTPPNPAELLASTRMDAVLHELDAAFDIVVLDATPLVPVTDAAALAGKVGHVLLVASAGTSRRRTVERMVEVTRLTDAHVLGVAFNRVQAHSSLSAGYYDRSSWEEVSQDRPAQSEAGGEDPLARPPLRTDQPARTP